MKLISVATAGLMQINILVRGIGGNRLYYRDRSSLVIVDLFKPVELDGSGSF
jgi:hypothetical protein